MQGRLLFCSKLAACATFVVMSSEALAGARNLPATPPDAAQVTPPGIHITPATPAVQAGPSRERNKAQTRDTSQPGMQRPSEPSRAGISVAGCEPDNAMTNGLDASQKRNQIALLRATASGTVTPENARLSPASFQRVQANAAWQMGLLTLHGICVVLNTADAAQWFERAQLLGEPLAAAGLAWCEIEGCRAAANPAAAGKWVELLRSVDAPRALYLQWLMQSRLAPLELTQSALGAAGHPPSPLPNRQLLASAAQQGDTNAKIELGLNSVFLNELPEALVFFKSAAPKSAAAAINSAVVAERVKNAARLMPPSRANSASSANSASGAVAVKPQSAADNYAQAQRYHRGQGVPSNYTEAIRLYQLAQNQGNAPAKKMLALIFSRPAPNGQIDLAWMQQLAQVDVSSTSPTIEQGNARLQLRREPTPLFDLVPLKWRRYVLPTVAS
jgi:uncharacterized protein